MASVDLDPLAGRSKSHLVGVLDLREAVVSGLVHGVSAQPELADPGVRAGDLVQERRRRARVCTGASGAGDIVGLVVEALGPDGVSFAQGLAAGDLCGAATPLMGGRRGRRSRPCACPRKWGPCSLMVPCSRPRSAISMRKRSTSRTVSVMRGEEAVEDGDLPGLQGLGLAVWLR